MTYADVIAKVREQITDPDGNRWTDAEITDYIDLAQRRISIASLALSGSLAYVGDSTLDFYSLPDDFLEFTAFVLPNGKNLDLLSADTLDKYYTAKFLTDQTAQAPIAICLDFGSWNELRFYPNPETGVAIGTLEYKRLAAGGSIEIEELDALADYALFRMNIKQKSKEFVKKAAEFLKKFESRERDLRVHKKSTYSRVVHGSFF